MMSPLPPVVGINLGNSYASIAVVTEERVAECILGWRTPDRVIIKSCVRTRYLSLLAQC